MKPFLESLQLKPTAWHEREKSKHICVVNVPENVADNFNWSFFSPELLVINFMLRREVMNMMDQ